MNRDVDADYKAAYIAEYQSYRDSGRHDAAERVARILRDSYGYDVAPKRTKRPAPERADVDRPPENTAEPAPKRRGRPPGSKNQPKVAEEAPESQPEGEVAPDGDRDA